MTSKRFFQLDFDEVYYIFDNEQIPKDKVIDNEYGFDDFSYSMTGDEVINTLNNQQDELDKKEKIIEAKSILLKHQVSLSENLEARIKELDEKYIDECSLNETLRLEVQRLTAKLNETGFEFLKHGMISMGKAVEISEMSYHDFIKYRAEKGFPMELQI